MRKLMVRLMALALGLALAALSGHAEQPKKADRVAALMQKKLEHAQKVLEGLALNDFDRITRNADDLMTLSKQAEWKVLKTPQYEVHSNEFRRITEEMIKSAREKNLDGAALNYVELTLTCVKCHKYVREIRMTKLDD
jgi:hypothetical protein